MRSRLSGEQIQGNELIGQEILHYKILEKLGEGGMGVVYKAEDTKLKRPVALKFLPSQLTKDQDAIERFITEARAASALDHPNICTIYEINETDDGQMFISMAYYSGQILRDKIAGNKLPVAEAVNITRQIAAGLAKAHDKNIVHRDIKPGNIIVQEDGPVKIIDFGLSKLLGVTRLTKSGQTPGTLSYMSPEQVENKPVDHRSDIWSLGVIMYEMLAGELPFKGEYEVGTMYSILNVEPEPLTTLRQDVSVELEQIVHKALTKNPDERYQNVDHLLTDLRSDPQTVPARKSPFRSGPLLRNKVVLAWPYLVLSAIVIAIAGYFLFSKEPASTGRIPIAVVSFENITGDTTYNYLQKAIPNLLITSLEQSPNLEVATWERLHDLLKQTGREYTELIDKDLGYELCRMDGINTIVIGSFVKAGNAFTTEVRVLDISSKRLIKGVTAKGRGEESILLSQIDELSREISRGVGLEEKKIATTQRPIAEVTTSSMQAYNYFIRGREYYELYYQADARRLFERAVELDSTFATAHLYLAMIYSNFDRRLAIQAYEKAMAYSRRTPEKERLFIETNYARSIERNPEKADSILQQIVQKYPKEKRMRYTLARQYRSEKQYEKAIDEFHKVLDLDPDFVEVYNQFGYVYAAMGDFGKAIEYLQQYAALSPGDANPFDSMAEVYLLMGNVDAAIANFNEVLAIKPGFPNVPWRLAYCRALQEDYPGDSTQWLGNYPYVGYHSKGFYEYMQGSANDALMDLQRASRSADSLKNPRWKTEIERSKGWIYYDRGEFDAGRIAIQKLIDHRMKADPKGEPYHKAYHSFYLGMVNLRLGQIDAAETHLDVITAVLPQAEREQNEQPGFHHDLLHAEILLAEGLPKEAIAVRRKIKYGQVFMGLPGIWAYNVPFRDDIAARAYLQQGDLDGAIAEYERGTTIDPKSSDRRLIPARFHYRLAKLYEQKGLSDKAIARYEHFLTLWKNADPDWPELNDAKARLMKLKETAPK